MENRSKRRHHGIRGILERGGARSVFGLIRKTPLRFVLQWVRNIYRNYYFDRAMKKLLSNPQRYLNDRDTLTELSYGWGNEGWSASVDYLEDCVKYIKDSELPILECGSGLSTIVVGVAAKEYGKNVWSLEHMESWCRHVNKILARYNIDSVKLIHGAEVDHGGLPWYDAPFDSMPGEYSLVLCDGPAGTKNRSKPNIFPIMKDKFAAGCIILFDDIPKITPEDDIPGWIERLDMSSEIRGTVNPYYVLKMPQHGPESAS